MASQKDRRLSAMKPVCCFIQTLPRILCTGAISRVSFLDLFGPDCWGNISYYVITSPANCVSLSFYVLHNVYKVIKEGMSDMQEWTGEVLGPNKTLFLCFF